LGEKFKEAGNLLGKSLGEKGAYNIPKSHQGGANMKNHLQKSLTSNRRGITLLAYLYGYAIGYSFFRKSPMWG